MQFEMFQQAHNGLNTVHLDAGLIREVGEPGCVLALQNLPPGTSLLDIETFLKYVIFCLNRIEKFRQHSDTSGVCQFSGKQEIFHGKFSNSPPNFLDTLCKGFKFV